MLVTVRRVFLAFSSKINFSSVVNRISSRPDAVFMGFAIIT